MASELEVLFPDGKTVTCNGEEITVKPFTFGQIPKVVSGVRKISGLISGESINVLEAIETGGEDLIALVGLLVGKSRNWFDTLPADEGVALMAAILEVNQDFFVKKVAPLLPMFLSPKEESSQQPTDGEPSPDA